MPAIDPARAAEILGNDPLAGNLAIEYFASLGLDGLRFLLWEAPGASGQFSRRLARLCRRLGPEAVAVLFEALEKGAWRIKNRAAEGFDLYPYRFGDPALGPLSKLAMRDFDTANACMLALGYAGAYGYVYAITEDIASPSRGAYVFGKLGGTALKALMLMAPRTKEAEDVVTVLKAIEKQFENLEKYDKPSNPGVDLRWGAHEFGPSAADPMVRLWLTHKQRIYREVALESLSVIGLQRTAPAIAERLLDPSEDDSLRSDAARYLGDIGGAVAAATLEGLLAGALSETIRSGVLWGLASLYPEAANTLPPAIITEILASESQMRLHLVHSLGFRREGESALRAALHDRDAMVRGAAALSLARTLGGAAAPLLRVALREASDDFEQALVLCGLIRAGEQERTQELHQALCRFRPRFAEIWQLQERWKREFVGALAVHPDARYAEAWSEVLRVDTAASLEKLAAWGGAYPVNSRPGSPPAVSEEPMPQRDSIFISYSHADEKICQEFLKMLRPLAQTNGLKIWSDHEIPVGAIWREEIEKALARTRIAVLLVSPDFLDSDFIQKNELPPLLAAAKTQGARIFWIACRPCNVEATEIGKFQGVNRPSRPLSALTKKSAREQELQRITQQLLKVSQAAE
jgi:TIR domain